MGDDDIDALRGLEGAVVKQIKGPPLDPTGRNHVISIATGPALNPPTSLTLQISPNYGVRSGLWLVSYVAEIMDP